MCGLRFRRSAGSVPLYTTYPNRSRDKKRMVLSYSPEDMGNYVLATTTDSDENGMPKNQAQ